MKKRKRNISTFHFVAGYILSCVSSHFYRLLLICSTIKEAKEDVSTLPSL